MKSRPRSGVCLASPLMAGLISAHFSSADPRFQIANYEFVVPFKSGCMSIRNSQFVIWNRFLTSAQLIRSRTRGRGYGPIGTVRIETTSWGLGSREARPDLVLGDRATCRLFAGAPVPEPGAVDHPRLSCHRDRSVSVGADRLAAVPRAQRPPDLVGDVVLDEADRPVREADVNPTGVIAARRQCVHELPVGGRCRNCCWPRSSGCWGA